MSDAFNAWWNEVGVWSTETFGTGYQGDQVLRHIEKEIAECRAEMKAGNATASLEEWADIAQLAMDGARRAGFSADEFLNQLFHKLDINKARDWKLGSDGVFEHVRKQSFKQPKNDYPGMD